MEIKVGKERNPHSSKTRYKKNNLLSTDLLRGGVIALGNKPVVDPTGFQGMLTEHIQGFGYYLQHYKQ